MPTGVNYQITHKEDNNYTWNKESVTGTTDLSGSNEIFNATYKYSPVKYSLDTNIIVLGLVEYYRLGIPFEILCNCKFPDMGKVL